MGRPPHRSQTPRVHRDTLGPTVGKQLGNPNILIISESDLYKLVMRSDKPEALAFQHWIASEVLPSIRKTGTYALADHGREAMPLPEALGLAAGQAARGFQGCATGAEWVERPLKPTLGNGA